MTCLFCGGLFYVCVLVWPNVLHFFRWFDPEIWYLTVLRKVWEFWQKGNYLLLTAFQEMTGPSYALLPKWVLELQILQCSWWDSPSSSKYPYALCVYVCMYIVLLADWCMGWMDECMGIWNGWIQRWDGCTYMWIDESMYVHVYIWDGWNDKYICMFACTSLMITFLLSSIHICMFLWVLGTMTYEIDGCIGWMDRWMYGCMGPRMDYWLDGCRHVWKDDICNGWMEIHMYEQMHAADPFV